jgi:hypothetical protein
MSDIFDKLNLIFDGPDHVESIQHAENMRDALSYLVVQTHVEETFGAYDQVFLGVQFFAELAYRLAPSKELARSTLEMATIEGERNYYIKALAEADAPEDRDRIMKQVEVIDDVILKKQNDFLENAESFVVSKEDDSTKEKKDVN